ncbi:chromosome partitioning protein ParA (plasmid) [Borreliella bissettiae]|uniref:Chromosome partitioning protein ParA n=1 Tax=Borrelia bissettiae TaxID=64897 RepID=A0A1L8Z9Z4_BORBI|nr:ParA family protein [Borreliella bissettiae]OJH14573.1 chromosome partitioning protein ParA [Borreliella bissettiae]
MDIKKSDIITMASIKGGVGKSTLSILFSYVLKELGKKVLLIDLDPQNSLTSHFNRYISNIEKYNAYSMLKGDFHFNECIYKINDYISIIPSHPILGKFNSEAIDYKEIILEHHLNENIQNYNFDYVLLDTPPSLDFLLKNALNVTNYIVIPVQVEIWSIESFAILINAVNDITKFRKKIYNISIVENQFIKNRNTIKEVEDLLYKEYREYIKGKVHFSNSIKVLINGRLEPSTKEMYYKEIKDTLKNIFYL